MKRGRDEPGHRGEEIGKRRCGQSTLTVSFDCNCVASVWHVVRASSHNSMKLHIDISKALCPPLSANERIFPSLCPDLDKTNWCTWHYLWCGSPFASCHDRSLFGIFAANLRGGKKYLGPTLYVTLIWLVSAVQLSLLVVPRPPSYTTDQAQQQ